MTLRFSDFRLHVIQLFYGDCPPGTIGHSLVTLAREVQELRAQLGTPHSPAVGVTVAGVELQDEPAQ